MLSLAGGIAAVECARAFGAAARLSWPNDVVCEGRKLAGVLAELGPEGSVLLGIGMNLASQAARPARGRPPRSHLAAAGDRRCPCRAGRRSPRCSTRCGTLAGLFDAEGPAAIAARARALDALDGPAVRVASGERRGRRGHRSGHRATTAACSCAPPTSVRAYASGEVVRLT